MWGWGSDNPAKSREGGDGNNTMPDGSTLHLALYKYDACGFCSRVHRAIDQLEVKVEYRDVSTDRQMRLDHRERTGRTTVPALYIDDEPMFESRDIIDWLQERFPTKA